MDIILFIIILALIAYIAYSYFTRKSDSDVPSEPKATEQAYPYERKNLLSKTEYTFFRVLSDFCTKNNLIFCPKVRMEDFLSVTDKQNYTKYRGYIKSRHIDFLLCDRSLHVLCGIELDDKSHDTAKAQKNDNFKNKVFEQIKLPLFRIRTTSNYQTELEKIYSIIVPKKQEDSQQ